MRLDLPLHSPYLLLRHDARGVRDAGDDSRGVEIAVTGRVAAGVDGGAGGARVLDQLAVGVVT
jgi:hypothetical protein